MKYSLYTILAVLLCTLTSCLDDNDEPNDDTWRERNEAFMQTMSADPAYQRIDCPWDPQAYVLMRWHNDRTLTASALSPLYNSTIDVKYEVCNIDSTRLDSSYARTEPADSVYRTQLNKTITGWAIGIQQMHVGDSCTILIPYAQAYGANDYLSVKGYSDLIFNVKLMGIPGFEKK